jgi:hypothetical protein
VWHAPSWAGGRKIEAAAEFSAVEPQENAPSLRGAIDAVLGTILPQWTLTSPFVRVSLAGSHVMAAILPFVKLPASAADRGLVITQRFCREHRLEPSSIAVIGCPQRNSKNVSPNILCLAADRRLLGEIKSALTGRGLYPDVIGPEYLLSLAEAAGNELEMPAIAVFEQSGCNTILVWDKQGTIIHVATVGTAGEKDLEVQRRMAARIKRYAQIVAAQGAPLAVYIDSPFAVDLTHPAHGLKLLRWPAPRQIRDQRSNGPDR